MKTSASFFDDLTTFYSLSLMTKTGDDVFDEDVKFERDEFLLDLKEKILDILFFCICAEGRHVGGYFHKTEYDRRFSENPKDITHILYHMSDQHYHMRPSRIKWTPDLHNNTKHTNHTVNGVTIRQNSHLREVMYYLILRDARKTGRTQIDYVSAFEKYFSVSSGWCKKFGGFPWAKACRAWKRLYNAKSSNDIIVYIDHIIDLQHHTGVLLNKSALVGEPPCIVTSFTNSPIKEGDLQLHQYTTDDSTKWIKTFCNVKSNIRSADIMVELSTPDIKRLWRKWKSKNRYYGAVLCNA